MIRLLWYRLRETPYEVAIALIWFTYGVAASILGSNFTPTSLNAALPASITLAWCLLLTTGSGCVLAGRLWALLQVEAVGLAFQLGAIITYALILVSQFPSSGGGVLFSSLVYITFASATAIRLLVVRRSIKLRRGHD